MPPLELIVPSSHPARGWPVVYQLLRGWGAEVTLRGAPGHGRALIWNHSAGRVEGACPPLTMDDLGSTERTAAWLHTLQLAPAATPRATLSFTFDVEETGGSGLGDLARFLDLLAETGDRATVFVTAEGLRALTRQGMLDALASHEVGNHTSDHASPNADNLRRGHDLISARFPAPTSFRAPRLEPGDALPELLEALDYRQDSSLIGALDYPLFRDWSRWTGLHEIPVLDGGDYLLFQRHGLSPTTFLARLRHKLRAARLLGGHCALLLHPQYSNFTLWREMLSLTRELGFATLPLANDREAMP